MRCVTRAEKQTQGKIPANVSMWRQTDYKRRDNYTANVSE